MEKGSNNSKRRLLALAEFFKKRTDEEHAFSAGEICDYLAGLGIVAERKAIYSDIEALRESGYDILCSRGGNKGFFLADREFQEAEARLMIDAVQTARFITAKKSSELVSKISGLLSEPVAEKMLDKIYISSANKGKNEEVYYNIDLLYRAICDKKQVSFYYYHHYVAKDLSIKTSERSFAVSPYALIWSNDHYYLISNNNRYNNLMHTRIDRIKKVKILDRPARPFSEVSEYQDVFDSADYEQKLFNMFSGTEQRVTMRCANSILEEIFDRFGDSTAIVSRNADNFTVTADVITGEGFISWVMQYGGRIEILAPQELRESVFRRVQDLYYIYQDKGRREGGE